MGMVNAFGERVYAEVMNDTWGHLAPEEKRVYVGTILYTVGECGDITCIRSEFVDLDGGPWLHGHIQDFMCSNGIDEEGGKVYRFDGTYCASRDEKFVGNIKVLDL